MAGDQGSPAESDSQDGLAHPEPRHLGNLAAALKKGKDRIDLEHAMKTSKAQGSFQ